MLGYIFTCIFKIRLCPRRLRPAAIDVLGLALSPSNVDLSSNRIRSRKSSNARRISIAARSQANQTWRAPRSPRSSLRSDPRPPVPICGRRVLRSSRSSSFRSAVVVVSICGRRRPSPSIITAQASLDDKSRRPRDRTSERPNVAVAPDRLAPHNLGPPPRDDHGDLVDDVHRRHLVDVAWPSLYWNATPSRHNDDRVADGRPRRRRPPSRSGGRRPALEFLRRRERRLLVVVARHLTRRRPEHRSAAPGPPRSPPSSRSSRVALPGAATTLPPRRLFSGAAASPDASEAPTHRCSSRSADAQMLLSQTTQERPEARLHRGLRARDDLALETDVGTTKHRRPAHEEHEEHEEQGAASSRRTNDRARAAHLD